MLKLTDADITEFQEIYKKETGREISKEDAAVYAERLVWFVAWVADGKGFAPPLPDDSPQHPK